MSYDELELDTLGDRKSALFLIMSDTDSTFNFVIAMLQSQLFNLLCDKADDEYNGNPAIFQNTMKTRQRIMKSRPPIWKMNSLRGSLRKRKSMSVFLMCGAAAARKPLLIAAVLLAMC